MSLIIDGKDVTKLSLDQVGAALEQIGEELLRRSTLDYGHRKMLTYEGQLVKLSGSWLRSLFGTC